VFPGFSDFEGTLEVEASGGSLSAVGLRYHGADRTVFTTTPVFVLP